MAAANGVGSPNKIGEPKPKRPTMMGNMYGYKGGSKANKVGPYYIDGYLRKNLDAIKQEVRQDNDYFITICGLERSGKSVLAQQVAHYLSDGNFTVDQMCVSVEDFVLQVFKADKYMCVVFDEAQRGASSGDYMKEMNRALKKVAMEMGAKNLFVIMVMPSVFELSKYYALHRSIAHIEVFKYKGARGYFKVWAGENKKLLYLKGKREMNMGAVRPDFFGRFTNYYCIDEKAYRAKKTTNMDASLKSYMKTIIEGSKGGGEE